MNNRKLSLDYLKFVGIIIIIFHHSNLLDDWLFHGYILVELFFMISGYLLVSECEKNKKIDIFAMMKKRLKRIYPEYFFAWVLIFLASIVGYRTFPYTHVYKMIAEILMVQSWYKIGGLNSPAWYISVMILAEILILLLYKFFDRKKYIIFTATLVILIYVLLIYNSPTNIEVWDVKGYIFYIPFWRGFADMMLGGLIYYVSSSLQGKLNAVFINILYFSLLGVMFALLFVSNNTDYICVVLIWLVVLLSTFDCNVLNKFDTGKFHDFITKYQYGLFLNHACIVRVFKMFRSYFPNKIVSIIILIIMITAGTVIYTQLQRFIMKLLFKKRKQDNIS